MTANISAVGETVEPRAVAITPPTKRVRLPGGWTLSRTQLAVGAWLVLVALLIPFWGLPTNESELFTIITLGLVAAGVGNPRAWARVLRDWVPLFALLTLYDILRSHADEWSHIHFFAQIHADEWLFGGTVPTLHLQHALFTPGSPHWWDYLVFLVYISHFFASLVIAALLWKFAYPRFRRFAAVFVGLTFLGFVTYALFPAAPPWLASQTNALAPTSKIIDEMWSHLGILKGGAHVFSATSNLANPVAAVPSLHAAYPFLLMLFFWRSAGRWRWLLPLYPIAMGFTLVYSGEHYVFDILLGWLYATAAFWAGNVIADRWSRRRARRSASPTEPALEPIPLVPEPALAGVSSQVGA